MHICKTTRKVNRAMIGVIVQMRTHLVHDDRHADRETFMAVVAIKEMTEHLALQSAEWVVCRHTERSAANIGCFPVSVAA